MGPFHTVIIKALKLLADFNKRNNNLDDPIEVIDDDYESDDIKARIFVKEDDLIISRELNLDANAFIKDLDEIVEDSDNIDIEEENIQDIQ
ncbi:hypothetical protein C1646_753840 [Rhizophagus diaphanus]|nr:hypothetical protein C1646_753840 [Rhizophagus diaphanus] [Rhizophagus sp. MUCL 43196]